MELSDEQLGALDVDIDVQEVLLAAAQHDISRMRELIQSYDKPGNPVNVKDPETGYTPLHAAIAACEPDSEEPDERQEANGLGNTPNRLPKVDSSDVLESGGEMIKFLLQEGGIWNDLDANDETPGCMAKRMGLDALYQLMVDAGVRAEMLLNRLDEYAPLQDEDEEIDDDNLSTGGAPGQTEVQQPNEQAATAQEGNTATAQEPDVTSSRYLQSNLTFTDNHLLDQDQNGVMMSWESGKDGMRDQVWVIHEGKWQDILPELVNEGQTFDAIYYDTFAESYSDFRDFFSEQVIGLLDMNGKWSFFNGMGADRQISYDVYQKVVEMDLLEAGFDVDWEEIGVPSLEGEWNGVRRRYWVVDSYRLPVCRYLD
ncbi:arginine N-methyltransferase 2 [Coccidioides immitis RMSCC 3703]|uniref:Arginine N-methyltransferase 2 n=1 Tax=Coccidioides immitis RMSCC 3703 TaxID=454286 RepID=A0A0J8QK65_COCIT|nr:arginine N-methyltransferase 2 [Coccidioides immitis RMSCC 3703]